MEVLKEWARSVSLVAVLCSMILMLAPARMKKNVAFVLEVIILIAVIAPAWRWIALVRARPAAVSLDAYLPRGADLGAYHELYFVEVQREVEALVRGLGFRVSSIKLESGSSSGSLERIVVSISPGKDMTGPSIKDVDLESFRKILSLFTGVPEPSVLIQVSEGVK